MRWTHIALATGLLALPAAAQDAPGSPAVATPAPSPSDLRDQAYDEFRAAFGAGRYAEALPAAQRVVDLTEAVDRNHPDLAVGYNNLGAVQLKVNDLAAAEKSYRKALELLEGSQGVASRRLVAPLGGLGTVLAAQGQHGNAVDVLNRAVNISRRADGLFNTEQLDLIDSLCESYLAIGDYASVDRERLYALRIVEQQYGARDARTVPQLAALAQWYERTQRHVLARLMHTRAYEIAAREAGGRNQATIAALRGITRSYRLQYATAQRADGEPQPLGATFAERQYQDRLTIDDVPGPSMPKLDPDGELAINEALRLLEASPGAPEALRGATLVDAGDWAMVAGDYAKAVDYWTRALPLLPRSELEGGNPLARPRPVYYRQPDAQVRNVAQRGEGSEPRTGEFRFTVTPDGRIRDVTVERSELTKAQENQVRKALEDAVYAPRFEDGKPVETAGVSYTTTYYDHSAKKSTPTIETSAR